MKDNEEEINYSIYFAKKDMEQIDSDKTTAITMGVFALIGLVGYNAINNREIHFSLDTFKSWNELVLF